MVESIKLLDVLEANLDEIAAHWAADVKKTKERRITGIFLMRSCWFRP